jgi:PilZ domain
MYFMEKRSAPRKPVLMSGVIKFADITVNCLICDVNISGAAIEVSNPQDIPECFNILFKGDDIPLPCYVVWRKADRIGVAFEIKDRFGFASVGGLFHAHYLP